MKTPQALTFVVLFRLALSALPVEAAQTITTTSVNGDVLTVKLNGPGFVSCSLGTEGTGQIDQLLVRGTDEKSALTIKVKKSKTGDGRVRINSIRGDSSLGELHADSADIIGTGISFDGSIGMLAIGNLINSAIDLGGEGIRAGEPSLRTFSVAGLISNSVVNVNGTITTVSAKRVVNSEIAAGYRPSATNNPMGGGTFKVGAQIKRVTIQGAGASLSPAFLNSVIAASEIEDVTIESARCDNGGHPFGVLADRKIGRVQVTTPEFSYSAKEAWGRAMGDFIVDPGLAVIITANTRILAEADLSKAVISTNLLVLDPTGSSAQGLVPGDILVGTTNHPFLSRVVSVKHVGGQLEILIKPARLSDAIRRGSLHLSIPLSPDGIKYRASGVRGLRKIT